MENKRYKANKSNKGIVPKAWDARLMKIEVPCGKCYECRKKRAREWQVRLSIEVENTQHVRFMTMTFSDEAFEQLKERVGHKIEEHNANEYATEAIKLFLKRWKKIKKEPLKHWLVTELGHKQRKNGIKATERLHLHGFLWTNEECSEIERIWKYGWVDTGEYVNQQSVCYCVKYVSKVNEEHPNFIAKVFASPGLGKQWLETKQANDRKYKGEDTIETFKLPNGQKIDMPTYFRRKLINDEEREKLRIQRMEKGVKYICGEKVESQEEYENTLKYRRVWAENLGYKTDGNLSKENKWKKMIDFDENI